MKIKLNKTEKTALLKAAASGVLDTKEIPELVDKLQDGKNSFLETLKQLPDIE